MTLPANTTTDVVRILIADDHPVFIAGLRALLQSEEPFVVVGQAGDGQEAVRLVETLRPDVVLLDLMMPRVGGLDALRMITAMPSPPHVLLLTAAISRRETVKALQLGAHGVVLKEATPDLVVRSVRAVLDGQFWVGRECVSDLVRYLRAEPEASPDAAFGLSPRERQIVAAVVAGCSNREIARRFDVQENTVKHHLTNVFDKLGVSSRLELALFAVDHDLVERD
jgi:DNA-binding NarL/FixJ family response regulator